jgi:hypothetical protein
MRTRPGLDPSRLRDAVGGEEGNDLSPGGSDSEITSLPRKQARAALDGRDLRKELPDVGGGSIGSR